MAPAHGHHPTDPAPDQPLREVPAIPLAPALATLDRLIAAWLDSKAGSARTLGAYRETLGAFRAALLAAGLDLDGDPRAVALAAQAWMKQRDPGARAAGPAAPATQRQRLAIISSFYRYGLRMGLLAENPISRVERPRVQAYARAVALDPAEVRRRLQALDRATPAGLRDYALLLLGLTTGRRLSELAALRWADVRLSGEKVVLTFRAAKGGKVLRDALAPSVARALLAWLQHTYGATLGALAPDAPLWPSLSRQNPGAPLSARAIDLIVRKRLGCHPHQLRHSFAHAMEARGARVSEIQARLGHESLETTGRYLRALTSEENRHAPQIAELFSGEA